MRRNQTVRFLFMRRDVFLFMRAKLSGITGFCGKVPARGAEQPQESRTPGVTWEKHITAAPSGPSSSPEIAAASRRTKARRALVRSPPECLELRDDLFSNGPALCSRTRPDIRKHSISAAIAGMNVQKKQRYRTPSPVWPM